MSKAFVHLIELGDWGETDIHTDWSEQSSWALPDARLQKQIDDAWEDARQSPSGAHLFDGAMCRLESHAVEDSLLHLKLSPTSYRIFFGTNMQNPPSVEPPGRASLANPLGISAALISSDGWLVLGRRSTRVAYYPERVHPFAGSVEPRADAKVSINVFDDVRRELKEELHLCPNELTSLRCIGFVQDARLRQPELIFETHTSCTRAELDAALDALEHGGTWSAPATEHGLTTALHEPLLTPVATASVLLLGRRMLGSAWFERHAVGRINLR